jgi:hypothetical protein
MRRINRYNIHQLKDIKENMPYLIEPLLNAWDDILLFDPTIEQEEMKLKYNNVNFWLSLIERSRRSYLYELRKLRNYTIAYTLDIQAEVRKIMEDTLNDLL